MKRFNPQDAVLLVIDVQVRLVPALANRQSFLRYNVVLLELATTYDIPILYTEQYPKGLGPTLPDVKNHAPDAPTFEKTAFTAYVPDVAAKLKELGKKQIIVSGAETHICVYQTVLDLLEAGYEPFIPRDAVSSRTKANRDTALATFGQAGAVVTSTETLLFEALGEAGTPEFKKLSKLIR